MHCRPNLWGHERVWLPDDQRQKARQMRLQAAQNGDRMPVQVVDGNYERLSGVCPWWDATKAGSAD